MKNLFYVLMLTFAFGASAGEIKEQDKDGVLYRAKVKSYSVLFGLVQIEELGLSKDMIEADCSVVNPKVNRIECVFADKDESIGWTEGIGITWFVEHPATDNEKFWFSTIQKYEH